MSDDLIEQSAGSGRRPGRPRGAGVVSDDELLERALDMLAHGGFAALSMRGLARSFGVSLATVQHRFETKDVLWRAAVDRLITPPVTDPAANPKEFIDNLQQRIAAAAAHPGLIPSLLADDSPGHEDRNTYLAQLLGPSVDAARDVISKARDAGLLRDIDAGVLLATLIVGVAAVVALPPQLAGVLGLDGKSEDRLARGLGDLLIYGILQRPDDNN